MEGCLPAVDSMKTVALSCGTGPEGWWEGARKSQSLECNVMYNIKGVYSFTSVQHIIVTHYVTTTQSEPVQPAVQLHMPVTGSHVQAVLAIQSFRAVYNNCTCEHIKVTTIGLYSLDSYYKTTLTIALGTMQPIFNL